MEAWILLVEDNPDHALLIREALDDLGLAQVRWLTDGRQALDFVLQAPPRGLQLVLLDLKLPKVDGYDILCALRAQPAWDRVPVIVLTTSTRPTDVEQCLRRGANAYISKVTNPAGLTATVRDLAAHWLTLQWGL